MTLQEFFSQNPKAALGFSGGVDSAYLLAAAVRAGADVGAYFIKTPFQPAFELEDARRLAAELGVALRIVELDILDNAAVAANAADRCYHCKRALFGALQRQAQADGYELLIDGTNASDDASDRPGMRAIRELQVRSPLRECGLTKDEIRRLSREAGLFTWDKPAYACLATRVPVNTAISWEILQKIEAGEAILAGLGFRDFRLRLYGAAARIQVKPEQFALVIQKREQIRQQLSPWFGLVLLDLKER